MQSENDAGDSMFPAFDHFPEQQFKSIALGDANEDIIAMVSKMQVDQKAKMEVSYFYFPKDSTELIIPDQAILTEFKVFLYSSTYLSNEPVLRSFFERQAYFVMKDPIFQIFQFKTKSFQFKMTYFKQDDFIRLHFIFIPDHT